MRPFDSGTAKGNIGRLWKICLRAPYKNFSVLFTLTPPAPRRDSVPRTVLSVWLAYRKNMHGMSKWEHLKKNEIDLKESRYKLVVSRFRMKRSPWGNARRIWNSCSWIPIDNIGFNILWDIGSHVCFTSAFPGGMIFTCLQISGWNYDDYCKPLLHEILKNS